MPEPRAAREAHAAHEAREIRGEVGARGAPRAETGCAIARAALESFSARDRAGTWSGLAAAVIAELARRCAPPAEEAAEPAYGGARSTA